MIPQLLLAQVAKDDPRIQALEQTHRDMADLFPDEMWKLVAWMGEALLDTHLMPDIDCRSR